MRAATALLSLVLTLAPAFAQEVSLRPLTIDDALDMVSVGGGTMSPDGTLVLYTLRKLDWEGNEYDTEVWIAAADGSDSWRFLGEEGGSDFAFSPDGKLLTFKRSVGEGKKRMQQLFAMRMSGGEAIQLSEHDTSVGSYRWAEDSSRIFFVADDARPKDEQKAIDDGDDGFFVDEDANGQTMDAWSSLWVFDADSKEEHRLTEEHFLVGSFDVSPDASRVAFTARATNRRNDADKTEIYLLDVASGDKQRLTENRAPEGGIVWRPDGKGFLFEAADDAEWLNRNGKFWLMDALLGEHRLLSAAFPGEVGSAAWSPDGRYVLFSGSAGADSDLFRLDAESGAVERLTHLGGSVSVQDFSRDRTRFVYSFSDSDTPADLWVGDTDGSAPVRITDANPQIAGLQLASMRKVRWNSSDGTEIEGLVHLPPGYEEGKRYPLMLNIHGGPAGVFSNAFRTDYHIYAGLGWVSLSPNVRGSCCYDDALREGNTIARGDGIGMGDYQDVMTGVDFMIREGIADADHLALRGWSYGGILGGWTITKTDRFKAASIGAGVYDWTSEYGPGFNNDVRLWHIGGTPWDNPEGYRSQSALTHAANVTAATLLIHGMNDTTDTEPQSMMFFTALNDIGKVPVRYLRVPREPHGFREPRHQRARIVEEVRWMQQHVIGQEWTPWERPKAAEKDDKDDEEIQD